MIFHNPKSVFWILVPLVTFFLGVHPTQSGRITILATGDTMLDSWIEALIPREGYAYPFVHIKSQLDSADIHITNLEAPFGTGGKAFDKRFTFRVKPELVQVLKEGNVSLVSLGNNHTMDYGESCITQTRTVLTENGIKFAGAGANLAEARKPALLTVKGKKIGFLSYNLTFPEEFWATDSTAGTCFPFESYAFSDIAGLKKQVDYVIVACHWGEELRDNPKPYQIKLAHRFIDQGADVVLGHHPHVIQGIEFYRNKPIAYSLGNFVFASYSESVRESMMLRLVLEDDAIMLVQVVPINVYNREVEFQPVPLAGKDKEVFLQRITRLSQELNKSPLGMTNDGYLSIVKENN